MSPANTHVQLHAKWYTSNHYVEYTQVYSDILVYMCCPLTYSIYIYIYTKFKDEAAALEPMTAMTALNPNIHILRLASGLF